MPDLLPPLASVRESFLAALREYHGEDRHLELDPDELAEPRRFAAYAAGLRADPAGTTRWYVDGARFLGRVSVQHRLTTEYLREYGGHIGYEVRPSARRQGHATRMLALALPLAREAGVDPALVTCDRANEASRRVIERNGGRFQDERDGKLRYRMPTGGAG